MNQVTFYLENKLLNPTYAFRLFRIWILRSLKVQVWLVPDFGKVADGVDAVIYLAEGSMGVILMV